MLGDFLTGGGLSSALGATTVTLGSTYLATYGSLQSAIPVIQSNMLAIDFTRSGFVTIANTFKDIFNPQEHIYEDDSWIFKDFLKTLKLDAGLLFSSPLELDQTLLGNTIAHFSNTIGKIDNIYLNKGSEIIENKSSSMGFTIGPYINIGDLGNNYTSNSWFVHEYGHTVQSKLLGSFYLLKVGIPSSISQLFESIGGEEFHDHKNTWFEINANQFGQLFYTPDYRGSEFIKSKYPTHFSEIDWKWFLFFNPFIF